MQVIASNLQKLVLVLAILVLVTEASKKEDFVLDKILWIYYLFCFYKNKKHKRQTLINSGRKINVMTPAYLLKLGLKIWHTNIEVQKIDTSIFKIFKMVQTSFQVENKFKKALFFQKSFLLADISMNKIFKMKFLTFSNANI